MTEGAKFELNEFHQIAALDRASLFANMVELHLLDEPFIKMVPEINEKISKAVELLNDAYVRIGGFKREGDAWKEKQKMVG